MRQIFASIATLLCLGVASAAQLVVPSDSVVPRRSITNYGVAFYNLENLFDTINANGKYDLEFSPQGRRQWDSEKYAIKINNLANAIANMVTYSEPQNSFFLEPLARFAAAYRVYRREFAYSARTEITEQHDCESRCGGSSDIYQKIVFTRNNYLFRYPADHHFAERKA